MVNNDITLKNQVLRVMVSAVGIVWVIDWLQELNEDMYMMILVVFVIVLLTIAINGDDNE